MAAGKNPITIIISIAGDAEGEDVLLLQANFQPENSWASAMLESELIADIFCDIQECLEVSLTNYLTREQNNESESERTSILDTRINVKGSTTLQ